MKHVHQGTTLRMSPFSGLDVCALLFFNFFRIPLDFFFFLTIKDGDKTGFFLKIEPMGKRGREAQKGDMTK